MLKNEKKFQKGQALLLVLLAMAAVMTVVLSVASKSVTDVSITSSEEDALRAFSAAEAGIEKSLLTGLNDEGNPDSTDTSVSYTSTITQNSDGFTFVYPSMLETGESATFWFVERATDGSYSCSDNTCFRGSKIKDLCWGAYANSSYASGEKPAVLLSLYYDWNTAAGTVGNVISSGGTDFSHVKVVRRGYDPDNTRASSNNFTAVPAGGCTIGNTSFAYHMPNISFVINPSPSNGDLSLPDNRCWNNVKCIIMMKVKVFYNNSTKPEKVALDMGAGSTFPAQGTRIESIGVAGESTRKVNVFQTFAEPPSIFDTAVFSLNDFIKN